MAAAPSRRSVDVKRYMTNTDKSIHNLTYVLADSNKPLSPATSFRPSASEASTVVTRRNISYEFASPKTSASVQSRRVTPSWLDNKGTEQKPKLIARVDQRDRAMNLFDGKERNLKIEHHYVDSKEEAEDLIDRLKKKGFIPAGIETVSEETN